MGKNCGQDKAKQLIMVVSKKDLFGKNNEYFFEGFRPANVVDYEERILENYGFMTRGHPTADTRTFAEQDSNYKQPIAYTLIINPILKKAFVYKRSEKDQHYFEKRLQGKWAWGIGGHIEMKDLTSFLHEGNPIRTSLLRELQDEEVEFVEGGINNLNLLGYIHKDEGGVHAVHFGMLYAAITNSPVIKPKDPEIALGELMDINQLQKIYESSECEVEVWSKISFNSLREYLS